MSNAMIVINAENDRTQDDADAPSYKALAVLADAHTKLASITTMEEAAQWHSEIAAVHHFLKCRRAGLAMQNRAALFKFQIERRMGQLLLAVRKVQGKRDETDGLLLTIRRSGLTAWAAYRWMALAKVPESELLRAAESCDSDGDELTSTLVHDVYVRRWLSRHADSSAASEADRQSPAEGVTLAQAKRDLEEWELLEPGALTGLSDLEASAVIVELHKAYEHYCEDPARGKVTGWGDIPPDSERLRAILAAKPSSWASTEGWYPPLTVDRRFLRHLAQEIISELKAGQGDGYHGIARKLDLGSRLRGSAVRHTSHDPLLRLLPCIDDMREGLFREGVVNQSRQVLVKSVVRLAVRALEHLEADVSP